MFATLVNCDAQSAKLFFCAPQFVELSGLVITNFPKLQERVAVLEASTVVEVAVVAVATGLYSVFIAS